MDSSRQRDTTNSEDTSTLALPHRILQEQGLAWRPNRDTLVAFASYGLVVAVLHTDRWAVHQLD